MLDVGGEEQLSAPCSPAPLSLVALQLSVGRVLSRDRVSVGSALCPCNRLPSARFHAARGMDPGHGVRRSARHDSKQMLPLHVALASEDLPTIEALVRWARE